MDMSSNRGSIKQYFKSKEKETGIDEISSEQSEETEGMALFINLRKRQVSIVARCKDEKEICHATRLVL